MNCVNNRERGGVEMRRKKVDVEEEKRDEREAIEAHRKVWLGLDYADEVL